MHLFLEGRQEQEGGRQGEREGGRKERETGSFVL